jgi:hypothetical protein
LTYLKFPKSEKSKRSKREGGIEMEDLDSLDRDYEDIVFEEPKKMDTEVYATPAELEDLFDEIVPIPRDEKALRRRRKAQSENTYPYQSPREVVALYRDDKHILKNGFIGIDDRILQPHHKGIIIELTYTGYDFRRIHPNLYWCGKEQFRRSPMEEFPGADGRSTRQIRILKLEDLLELK